MTIGPYLAKITINMNALNLPTKRHRMVEWISSSINIFPTRTHFRRKDTLKLKMKE